MMKKAEQQGPWVDLLAKAYIMGIGMATGAYDMLVINYVMLILEDLYQMGPWQSSIIASASIAGTIFGQLIFGFLGDVIGRKRSSLITCSLLFFGALFSGVLCFVIDDNTLYLFGMLSVWRFTVGTGIGGEYPVTAIFTSENCDASTEEIETKAEEKISSKRGKYISAMFSSQGLGNVIASITFLSLLLIFSSSGLKYVWRIALIIGAIPPLLIFIPRARVKESTDFTNQKENKQKVSIKKVFKVFWKSLIGTALSWFLFDVVFYANSLFSGPILRAVGIGNDVGWLGIANVVAFNVFIAIMALPGYWTAVLLIDKVGRRPLQLIGFAMMTIIYLFIGFSYSWISTIPWLFTLFYGLSYFFSNAGPNTTTFVIPTETYPTCVRSTCHGLSAASGKLGAVCGAFFIKPILEATNPQTVFIICGAISILGFIVTFFFVKETKNVNLQELDAQVTPLICYSEVSQPRDTFSL